MHQAFRLNMSKVLSKLELKTDECQCAYCYIIFVSKRGKDEWGMSGKLGEKFQSSTELDQAISIPTVVTDKDSTGKLAILTVLARAADDPEFMSRLTDDTESTLKEYYTLTQEQKTALASGDIQKIEKWLGKLDKRLASWLWSRLCQEKW
jgi:hypothetical protein